MLKLFLHRQGVKVLVTQIPVSQSIGRFSFVKQAGKTDKKT